MRSAITSTLGRPMAPSKACNWRLTLLRQTSSRSTMVMCPMALRASASAAQEPTPPIPPTQTRLRSSRCNPSPPYRRAKPPKRKSSSFMRLRSLRSGLAPLLVGKIQKILPVQFRHRMFSRANEKAEVAIDQLICVRHGLGRQAIGSQESIDRVGRLEHVECTHWVGPGILDRRRQQNGSRRAQGDETVLIERQQIGLRVELLEFAAEPVRKSGVDAFHRFADRGPAWGCATATRLQRYYHRHAVVESARQHCGFAKARMAHYCDVVLVNTTIGHKVIHSPLHAPGPGGDGSPFVRRFGLENGFAHATDGIGGVGFDIAAIKRGHGVAAF